MSAGRFTTTWDGLPVSPENPIAVSVVVWRAARRGREWLILHRHHHGREFEGDWAWTPPSGARLPGEPVGDAARRELREETGLPLEPVPTPCGDEEVAVFVAEARPDVEVALDAEHDAFQWVGLDDVLSRCLPRRVADSVACVAVWLDSAAGSSSRRKLP